MGDAPAAEITALLGRMHGGDAAARDALLPLVYKELEQIARAYVNPAASLEPRGLVHELYLKLVSSPVEARDRKHFYAIAALAMRQILADRARRRKAAKRGGPEKVQVTLSGLAEEERHVDVLAVDDALTKLEELSPRQARIVELRCLIGMSVAETADALEVSERTVHSEWRLARAWLSRELDPGPG
ncbi:MAG: sigma-70 family RNA polymerase sigma factor [Myxococcales bacterium]|nr:sigma-70 family RNA polymerase sigma factor [Myxococcales bacterium]